MTLKVSITPAYIQVCGGSPADSDTADSDERITISQRTGYINVKPRPSLDGPDDQEPPPGSSPRRRGSLPAARRVSGSSDRVATPPRKILPKTELDGGDRSGNGGSPAGGRTNHLPVGVMGAAGLSSRKNGGPVAMSKPSAVSMSPVTMLGTSLSIQWSWF